jgi:hypothetical protein
MSEWATVTTRKNGQGPDHDQLAFPAFLFGTAAACRAKGRGKAKKWTEHYQKHGCFPEPTMAPVKPGTIIFVRDGSDFQYRDPQWRLYGLSFLRWNIGYSYEARAKVEADFEAFACKYPWGALAVALGHTLYNTIDAVSKRIEAVLSFWEQLDTLRYFDIKLKPVTLAEMLAWPHFPGPVAMWVDQPSGDIRVDLRTAIDKMRKASDTEIRDRLMPRLRETVETYPEFEHRERLREQGVLEDALSKLEPCWYDDLTAGDAGAHIGFISRIDRSFSTAS